MPEGGREDLLLYLKRAQDECTHLSKEIIIEVSRALDLPVSDVFGVASFYSFLSTKLRGRNVIRVCRSVPCYLKDSPMIVECLADRSEEQHV